MAEYVDGGGGRFGKLVNSMSRGIQSGLSKTTGTYYPTTMYTTYSGWLKKHGGTLRSWQKRWFCLKEDKTLYYFNSDDESKGPVGHIYLRGYRIIELPQTNEPDKYLFDIVPGDSPRVGASTFYMFDDEAPQPANTAAADKSRSDVTYQLWAMSEEDRKAWVKALRNVLFSDEGGAIFGQDIATTLRYDRGGPFRKVPTFVEMCVEFLMNQGLHTEGIFRLPGRSSLVRTLKETFDSGDTPSFDPAEVDVHTVASLLKLYLRELPSPLVPFTQYENVIKIVTRNMSVNHDEALKELVELVQTFPQISYNMLQYLCRFLKKISRNEDVNKMTAMNLATCFVHSFIRPEEDDPALLMGTSNGRTQVTYILILHCDQIFSKEYTSQGAPVNVDSLIDGLDNIEPTDFDPVSAAKHSAVSDQKGADDLFTIDHQRESVMNLPQPIDPDGSCQFSANVSRGLSRSGSKRGGFVISDHGDDSERDSFGDDNDFPSPISDYFAVTPQSPPDELLGQISSPPRPQSQISPTPVERRIRGDTASSFDSGNGKSRTIPTIPPRPVTMVIPSVPPRPMPRTRQTASVHNVISNGMNSPEQERTNATKTTPPALENVDTSDLSLDQLQAHVRSLCEALKSEQADKEKLVSEARTMKENHKKAVQDLAAKLDVEKTNMARSVEKIMELTMKITNYEMLHGKLN